MGDQDRTERVNPQEPTPQDPDPAGPSSGDGDAASSNDEAADSVADSSGDTASTGPLAADPDPELPPDATTRFPADATAQLPLPGDATTQLPSSATASAPDETATHYPMGDHTRVMPPAPASWEGRAQVRPQHPGLRDSAPYPAAEPPPRSRTWWTPVLLGLVALGLVGLVVLAAWLLGRDTTPEPQVTDTLGPIVATSATPVAPTTQAPPSPTPSAAPELVEIPRIVGDSQATATAKLDAAGLNYRLDFRRAGAPRDTVIATDPEVGTQVPRFTTVVLVISLGQADPTPTTRPTPTASATPGG